MAFHARRLEPIEHIVGTDRTITIPLYDTDGTNLDVTGATAAWTLRKASPRRGRKPWSGGEILGKTSAAGGITLSTGSAAIAIADTDLSGKAGLHWQEIQITASGGAITTHGQGYVMLRAGL